MLKLFYQKRVLISISFAAVIQTLKDNPQTVKLFQNISTTNDGEQHKDNNNGITKYLEANKDDLLDLAEKHYENLVEALTNDAVNNAVASTCNPALSLSQSSSTFPSPSMQNDTYRIEESETYHNSKGERYCFQIMQALPHNPIDRAYDNQRDNKILDRYILP